jgi:purine catabolism regulator
MELPSAPISLVELLRLALPVGAEITCEADQRARVVQWAVVARLPLRADEVQPGDFVLFAPGASETDLLAAIDTLVAAGAAAVGHSGPLPQTVNDAACETGLPIVILPAGSDLREAHHSTLTLITNRQAQTELRASQIRRQLSHLVAEGAGLEAIVRAMADLTGKGVVIQDKRLAPLASWAHPTLSQVWGDVLRTLGDAARLPAGWSDRKLAAGASRIEHQALPGGLSRLIAPIVVKGLARGYLSFVSIAEDIDALDALVVEQGAEACALEMSKAKAVSEVTKALRGEFIDALLAGRISPQETAQWARQLGHNVSAPHAAIVFTWDGERPPSLRRLETLLNGELGLSRVAALVRLDAEARQVGAFVVLESANSIKPARDLAEAVMGRAAIERIQAPLRCGIGRPAASVDEWRTSYREAVQALEMARQLKERTPLYFGNLSVPRLLFKMAEHADLASFCQETLGRLITYDRDQKSSLIETLEAFFERNGNLSQTAEALFVHRNTLQYRMERISEIAGIDLENAETRLALQLALKAYRLLYARDAERPPK